MEEPFFRQAATATFAPLAQRFARGEGLLLPINASLVLWGGTGVVTGLVQILVSVLALALMYAFNDLYDSENDLKDRNKDQRLALMFHSRPLPFYAVLILEKAALVALAFLVLGNMSGIFLLAVFAINISYSLLIKSVPFMDVFWVGLWGACYACVPGIPAPARVILCVGVMTAICHIYQAVRDNRIDRENRIVTTAVFSKKATEILLFALCAALALSLPPTLGIPIAFSAFLPFALYLAFKNKQTSWIASKAYFGLAWLLILFAA